MKITISGRARVWEKGSRSTIDDRVLQLLDGWTYPDEQCGDYLDEDLADMGVTGGTLLFGFDAKGRFRVFTHYWSPARLNEGDVQHLTNDTLGQWSDGIAENGFEVVAAGKNVLLEVEGEDIEVEQYDDGTIIPPASRVVKSAKSGDMEGLKDALDAHEDVDGVLQGHTALHSAIRHGHVEAVLLLLEHRADPNRIAPGRSTPLQLCALSRSLSDEDSERVALALLSHGAHDKAASPTGDTALSYAENRGKMGLVRLLRARRQEGADA